MISFETLSALALLAVTSSLGAQPPARDTVRVAANDSVIALKSAADQTRGLDAELRAALYDLVSNRPMAALSRLEWLRSAPGIATTSPARDSGSTAAAGAARDDLLFLLAESYYRLGMTTPFRSTATELVEKQGETRYAGVVGTQLMLDAYRRGDYARVLQLAQGSAMTGDRALASLVAGLAAYQTGDYAAARQWLGTAKQSGAAYAPYAAYSDALASMQGDTTKAAVALAAMMPLTNGQGQLADQARLTASQLAYQAGMFDTSASLAGRVDSASGLGAQAMYTRAWALYRANQTDGAAAAFQLFARRYPNLPQRDEARLMAGQLMLQAKQSDKADAYFQEMADSVGNEVKTMQGRVATPMTPAAKALVTARADGVLFVNDPGAGKAMVLPDGAGANYWLLLSAFRGGAPASALPDSGGARLETLGDVTNTVQPAVAALGADFPMRVLYARSATPAPPGAYADHAEALRAADLSVAAANFRLRQALDDQQQRIASMTALQALIGHTNTDLDSYGGQLSSTRDSLGKVMKTIDDTRNKLREALGAQVATTRRLARENQQRSDSVRASLQGHLTSADDAVLTLESQTAGVYAATADLVESSVDQAIARNPAFTARDRLGVNITKGEALRSDTKGVLAEDSALVTAELARLRGTESDRARAARAAVASAEGQRAAAEGALVALVDDELRGRASSLLATLQRDREGADFGSASAAFFKAVDASGGTAGNAAAAPTAGGSAPAPSTPPER